MTIRIGADVVNFRSLLCYGHRNRKDQPTLNKLPNHDRNIQAIERKGQNQQGFDIEGEEDGKISSSTGDIEMGFFSW